MKTPKKNRNEICGNRLTIMLTDEQKNDVERQANELGVTMSAWARMAIVSKIKQK